jgi:hypothetical protein
MRILQLMNIKLASSIFYFNLFFALKIASLFLYIYLKILVHFNYIYTHANIINLLIFIYTHPITYIERNRIRLQKNCGN